MEKQTTNNIDEMSDDELRAKLKEEFKAKREAENSAAEAKYTEDEEASLQKVVTVADYNKSVVTTFKEAYLQGMIAGLYLAKIDPIEIGHIMGEKYNFVDKAIKFFKQVMGKLIVLQMKPEEGSEVKDGSPEACKDGPKEM